MKHYRKYKKSLDTGYIFAILRVGQIRSNNNINNTYIL